MNNVMSQQAEELIRLFQSRHSNPTDAHRAIEAMRFSPDAQIRQQYPQQAMGDASHYFFAKHYANQGLPQAASMLAGPFAWSAYKGLRQALGDAGITDRPVWRGRSDPTLTQLQMGQRGANEGFMEQLRGILGGSERQ